MSKRLQKQKRLLIKNCIQLKDKDNILFTKFHQIMINQKLKIIYWHSILLKYIMIIQLAIVQKAHIILQSNQKINSKKVEQAAEIILIILIIQYQESNSRIFEVYFGNKLVIGDLDIYQKVGTRTAYIIEISFQIVGEQIIYQGEQIYGAISKNNELIIRFKAIKSKAAIAGMMLKIGDNQVEIENIYNKKNTFKAIDGFKILSDESLKIIENEVKEIQKGLNNNNANKYDDANNRKSSKKEIKLFEFLIKLLNILIKSPFGIVFSNQQFNLQNQI